MKQGEIYWATSKAKKSKGHIHPIVILSNNEGCGISACILSTKSVEDNRPMKESFFVNDDQYTIKYNSQKPSYLVRKKYIKMSCDLKLKPQGKLTPEGLLFVEAVLKDVREYTHNHPVWVQNKDELDDLTEL